MTTTEAKLEALKAKLAAAEEENSELIYYIEQHKKAKAWTTRKK